MPPVPSTVTLTVDAAGLPEAIEGLEDEVLHRLAERLARRRQVEPPAKPALGQVVIYRSRVSGARLAAVVAGTVDSLTLEGIASGGVPRLSSDQHAHLMVLTPGIYGHGRDRAQAAGVDLTHNTCPGHYQEWDVPPGDGPGQWSWPAKG